MRQATEGYYCLIADRIGEGTKAGAQNNTYYRLLPAASSNRFNRLLDC
jgi:hypothetical protein